MKELTKEQLLNIKIVFDKLKNREIHPSGHFDDSGRFYLYNADLIDVRQPSRRYPYSQMLAGRTLKYVTAVANKFNCYNAEELEKLV